MKRDLSDQVNIFDLGSIAVFTRKLQKPMPTIERSPNINCCGGKNSSASENIYRDRIRKKK